MCATIQILVKDEKSPLPQPVIPVKFADDIYVYKIDPASKDSIFKNFVSGTLLHFTPDPKGLSCSCDVLGDQRQYAGDDFWLCEIDKKYTNYFKTFLQTVVNDLGFDVLFGIEWDGIDKYVPVSIEEFFDLMDKGQLKQDWGYEILAAHEGMDG